MISGKFLSVQKAANRLGCTPGRVRQLLRAGELHGEKLCGCAWAVRARSLADFERRPRGVGRKRIGDAQQN